VAFGHAKEKEINLEFVKIEPQPDDFLKFSATDDHLIGSDTEGQVPPFYFP
jgi:hypothetical protein